MESKDIIQLLLVLFFSSFKFGWVGVPAAIAAGYSFFKALTVTMTGALIGIVFFTYLSEWLIKAAKKIGSKVADPEKPKKKFTWKNKFVVRVKRTLGLAGIAFFTPPLLSFPVGVFFAVRYYKDKAKVISYMLVSTFAWEVILYYFYKYLFEIVKTWFA